MKNHILLFVTSILLSSCAGYSMYENNGQRIDHQDRSGLFYDTKGYSNAQCRYTYSCEKITKDEVIKAWGEPIERQMVKAKSDGWIKANKTEHFERWKYKRKLSFSGFMPILIIPIPLFWWPTGYYETTVSFNANDTVNSVYEEDSSFDLKKLCLIVPPTCISSLRLH